MEKKDGIKSQGLFRHAVGRATQSKKRHQYRDHPYLSALQPMHGAAYAGVDGPGGVHHPQKATEEEYEQGNINGIGRIAVRVIEARRRCQHDIDKALRVGLDGFISAGHRNFTPDFFIHGPFVLAGWNNPGQRCDHNDQQEQNRIGGGKSGFKLFFRVRGRGFVISHRASPLHSDLLMDDGSNRQCKYGRHRLYVK